ncbi:calcium uniporter regulatory subunit MCUb, mitochondrial isoform X2 [Crotalus tigris]|uniref:calcium uniporter regulatory subunit MCUb, mitochondrial isoform X2 n=1 Tax=Crotalus tigris TaxID=88082 RepID=UPI00192FAB54|nr:calcium uniporter regulatory subunit MCUb, mitochondrial isoform X2 [Crotalus tigris]
MLSSAHRLLRGRWQARTRIPMLPGPPFADGGRSPGGGVLRRVRLQMLCVRGTGNLRHHRRALYSTLVPPDEVTVHHKYGLPVITLTLPSRKERCQFTIKPMLTTVGTFLQDIKKEDNAIEKVEVFTADGSRISNSVSMEVLLMNDFKLIVNNAEYSVHPPLKDKMSKEHATEIDDIKSTIHKLFVALHLEEHQTRKEKELMQKMELLKEELFPLEQDYIYPDARDRQFLHYFHRKAKSQNFNMILYNKLKEDLAEVEESLKRLRNPLQLRLPVQEINDKH